MRRNAHLVLQIEQVPTCNCSSSTLIFPSCLQAGVRSHCRTLFKPHSGPMQGRCVDRCQVSRDTSKMILDGSETVQGAAHGSLPGTGHEGYCSRHGAKRTIRTCKPKPSRILRCSVCRTGRPRGSF